MASWNEPRARKRTQREINEGFDIIQNIMSLLPNGGIQSLRNIMR